MMRLNAGVDINAADSLLQFLIGPIIQVLAFHDIAVGFKAQFFKDGLGSQFMVAGDNYWPNAGRLAEIDSFFSFLP